MGRLSPPPPHTHKMKGLVENTRWQRCGEPWRTLNEVLPGIWGCGCGVEAGHIPSSDGEH